ncbi:sensor histidine kinase [Mucilaginibacter sp. NFR10]|uniref:sensor histidine kinase n=1 Tax=Mucilaginibacter sp. NFR10 TaxID=1566292 RepID=UPI0008715E55|nr:sensor histidine kinase [Mucilaginibacter sp. NFR10]SCW37625.1 Two-component sensor histidine kinase, contains HisKA and HATPase domains [Mucilaginibacter sp. NFR10]
MNINKNLSRFYCKLTLTGILLLISTNSPAQRHDHIFQAVLWAKNSAFVMKWDLIIVGIVALLFVFGGAYVGYWQKQINSKRLQLKEKEISEQSQMLQLLTADKNRLLDEKDWLLKEVHHRVKNNLQIVMSLLNTQSAFLKNNAALAAIRESQNRVQAIALIHQKLYSSSNVAFIDIAVYINELVNYLADCYDAHERGIRFEQQIERVKIDVAQAVPVGLMLNEAITNAIKYAFPHKRGFINISLGTLDDNNIMLRIADNGIGLPQGFDIKDASSLGMEMMKALSKQLGGNFKMENNEGVAITLVFRAERNFGNIENEYYPI